MSVLIQEKAVEALRELTRKTNRSQTSELVLFKSGSSMVARHRTEAHLECKREMRFKAKGLKDMETSVGITIDPKSFSAKSVKQLEISVLGTPKLNGEQLSDEPIKVSQSRPSSKDGELLYKGSLKELADIASVVREFLDYPDLTQVKNVKIAERVAVPKFSYYAALDSGKAYLLHGNRCVILPCPGAIGQVILSRYICEEIMCLAKYAAKYETDKEVKIFKLNQKTWSRTSYYMRCGNFGAVLDYSYEWETEFAEEGFWRLKGEFLKKSISPPLFAATVKTKSILEAIAKTEDKVIAAIRGCDYSKRDATSEAKRVNSAYFEFMVGRLIIRPSGSALPDDKELTIGKALRGLYTIINGKDYSTASYPSKLPRLGVIPTACFNLEFLKSVLTTCKEVSSSDKIRIMFSSPHEPVVILAGECYSAIAPISTYHTDLIEKVMVRLGFIGPSYGSWLTTIPAEHNPDIRRIVRVRGLSRQHNFQFRVGQTNQKLYEEVKKVSISNMSNIYFDFKAYRSQFRRQ